MSIYPQTDNQRFDGCITVKVRGEEATISADQFELAEADTRDIGDGDRQYEELWIARPEKGADADNNALFEQVQIVVTRLNDGPYEFASSAEIIGASTRLVVVEDNLELNEPGEQGPGVDPY